MRRFGGCVIRRHWTHSLFRLFRRSLGVQFEIQVLVIAELVGTAYYRLLRRSAVDPVLVQVCDLVLHDEAKHVEFHRERFATDQRHWLPLERAAWAGQFQMLFLTAALVVWLDHGAALCALGYSRRELLEQARLECIGFLKAIDIHTRRIRGPGFGASAETASQLHP